MRTVIELLLVSFARCRAHRKGQTMVEYALILAVLSIVLIAVFRLLDPELIIIFSSITTLLDTAQGSH